MPRVTRSTSSLNATRNNPTSARASTSKPSGAAKRRRSSPLPTPPSNASKSTTLVTGHEAFRLPLERGDVLYIPNFVSAEESEGWYAALDELETWYHPTLTVYGRPVTQSRSMCVYSTAPRPMRYSHTEVTTHSPMPAVLESIRQIVQTRLGAEFGTCMLNRYEGGGVYIGRHSDTRENKIIASLSLGATRSFVMTPRLPPRETGIVLSEDEKSHLAQRRSVRFALENRSLVVMQGQTQDFWKHEIPKEMKVKEGRISLTFRQIE